MVRSFPRYKLREIRRSRKIDQKTVAAALRVSQPEWSRWERGKVEIGLSKAWEMADFFSVPLDELAGRRFGGNQEWPIYLNIIADFLDLIAQALKSGPTELEAIRTISEIKALLIRIRSGGSREEVMHDMLAIIQKVGIGNGGNDI